MAFFLAGATGNEKWNSDEEAERDMRREERRAEKLARKDERRRKRQQQEARRLETDRNEKTKKTEVEEVQTLTQAKRPRPQRPQKPRRVLEKVIESSSRAGFFEERIADDQSLILGSLYGGDVPSFRRHKFGLAADGELFRLTESKAATSLRYYESGWLRRARRRGALPSQRVRRRVASHGAPGPVLSLHVESTTGPDENEGQDSDLERKSKALSELAQSEPGNPSVWMALARFQDELARAGRSDVDTANERKLMILSRGTAELERRSPGDADPLLRLYASIAVQHFAPSEAYLALKRILERLPTDPDIILMDCELRTSALSLFRVSDVAGYLESLIQESLRESETEILAIRLMAASARFWIASGYTELGTASAIAFLETNFFSPDQFALEPDQLLQCFDIFWSSGAPRLGEASSLGFRGWLEAVLRQEAPSLQNCPGKLDAGSFDSHVRDTPRAAPHGEHHLSCGSLNEPGTSKFQSTCSTIIDQFLQEEIDASCYSWTSLKSASELGQAAEPIDRELDQRLRVVLSSDLGYAIGKRSRGARAAGGWRMVETIAKVAGSWPVVPSHDATDVDKLFLDVDNSAWSIFRLMEENGLRSNSCGKLGLQLGRGQFTWPSVGIDTAMKEERARFSLQLLRQLVHAGQELSKVLTPQFVYFVTEISGASAAKSEARRLLKRSGSDAVTWSIYCALAESYAKDCSVNEARNVFSSVLGTVRPTSVLEVLQHNVEFELEYGSAESALKVLRIALEDEPDGQEYARLPSPIEIVRLRNSLTKLTTENAGGTKEWKNAFALRCHFENILEGLFVNNWTQWDALIGSTSDARKPVAFEVVCAILFREWCRTPNSSGSLLQTYLERGLLVDPTRKLLLGLYATYAVYTASKSGSFSSQRSFLYRVTFDEKADDVTFSVAARVASAVGDDRRAAGLLERGVERFKNKPTLWLQLLQSTSQVGDHVSAKKVFYRSIGSCPWSKGLWINGLKLLGPTMTLEEVLNVLELAEEKGMRLHRGAAALRARVSGDHDCKVPS